MHQDDSRHDTILLKRLHNLFYMTIQKVCIRMIPKTCQEQKDALKHTCNDVIDQLATELDLLGKLITCDEIWIYQCDLETKRQSVHWKTSMSPRMRKGRMSKLNMVAVLLDFFIFFFNISIVWLWLNRYPWLDRLTTVLPRGSGQAEKMREEKKA